MKPEALLRKLLVLALLAAGCASGPEEGTPAPRPERPAGETARPAPEGPDFERDLTVEECLKAAENASLTARSFKARLEAARGAAEAASAWPNPSVEYNIEDIGTVLNKERQLLQQEIVHYPVFFYWTRGLEGEVARADEARNAAQVDEDRRQLRLEIGRAFYELLASDESVKNVTEAVAIAVRLAEAASKRRALGDASLLDEQRAKTEELDARRDLSRTLRQRIVDGIAFALALGAEKPTAVKIAPGWPGSLPAEIASEATGSLVDRALAARPDVKQAEASVLKATKSLDLEGRKAIPLADWQISGGVSEGPEGYGAIFNATGPVPIFNWNGGNRRRARAELEGAVVDLERTRRLVAFDVESALITWNRSLETIERFAHPIQAAREANLEATRRLFAAGEMSYVDLLQAQRDAVAARRELVEAEKDAAIARWRLIVAVGQ